MDLPLLEPTEIPRPPEEVRFRRVRAEPYADGARVRLKVSLTPFQQRPNIEITVRDEAGQEVASTTIIENLDPNLSLTLHLSTSSSPGAYSARLLLRYPDREPVDQAVVSFSVPGLSPSGPQADQDTA
ncbi:MAG: hypothetical protein AB1449_12845 [Chloroflexota bacterium]